VYYLIYLALPVVGATSLVPAESPAGGPFAHLMRVIYDNFEPPGASFPSSHVGIAVLVLILKSGGVPPVSWFLCSQPGKPAKRVGRPRIFERYACHDPEIIAS